MACSRTGRSRSTSDDDDYAWRIHVEVWNDREMGDPAILWRLFMLGLGLYTTSTGAEESKGLWVFLGEVLARQLLGIFVDVYNWVNGPWENCVGPVFTYDVMWTPEQHRQNFSATRKWTQRTPIKATGNKCQDPVYEIELHCEDVTPGDFGKPPAPEKSLEWKPVLRGRENWLGRWSDQPAVNNGTAHIERSTIDPTGYRVERSGRGSPPRVETDTAVTSYGRSMTPVHETVVRSMTYDGERTYATEGPAGAFDPDRAFQLPDGIAGKLKSARNAGLRL